MPEQTQEAQQKKRSSNPKLDEDLKKLLEARKPVIKVVGAGGAGNNTITRMASVGIVGVDLIAINTDAQDLLYVDADRKILVGRELTQGLGAGADPKVGEEAAKESKKELKEALDGADMVFITCGLGGGTGTGTSPVIADIAKSMGALTVGVVTLPFTAEGKPRRDNADMGLDELKKNVDTLIVIPNDKLLEIVPDVSLTTAFKVADEILMNAVKGVAELITKSGLVNLDFADVRAVMGNGGMALIGLGASDTENRAIEAVDKALHNPLLDIDIEGAGGALVNVIGGPDISIAEAQKIVEYVGTKLDPEAKIIWGSQVDPNLGDEVRAMIIVTGVKSAQLYGPASQELSAQRREEFADMLGIDFVQT